MDRHRDSAKARDRVAPFNSRGKRSRCSPHHARARNPKPLVLAAFFGYFLSLVTESTSAGGIYRHKGCAGRNPPATAFPWPWGRELRIATGTSCPRNDKGFVRGGGWWDTWVPPYNSIFFVGQGPCALPGVEKESPSHGFTVTAPFRQEGLEGRGGGLPRALRALATTRVFARSAGALLMVRWAGNRKGRPSGKDG